MGTNERRRRANLRESVLLVILFGLVAGGLYYFFFVREEPNVVRAQFETAGRVSAPLRLGVAANARERALGLMYRKEMPADDGMLFVFKDDQVQRFWMKDTFIPLDIIFMDKDFVVLGVLERMQPLSTELRSIEAPCRYALEVNAGRAASLGVQKGSVLKVLSGAVPSARD